MKLTPRRLAATVRRHFDAEWYLAQNPDVARAGTDPLKHYLRWGWLERRSPSPSFDVSWYLSAYPDVLASAVEPFAHFLLLGRAEGRLPVAPDESIQTPPGTTSRLPFVPIEDHSAGDAFRVGHLLRAAEPLDGPLSFLSQHLAVLSCARSNGVELHLEADALIGDLPGSRRKEIRSRGDLWKLVLDDPERARVCFIIVQYGSSDYTLRCLRSIARIRGPQHLSVVVVDNASDDAHVDAVRCGLPDAIAAHLEVLDKNVGFARGNNIGYAIARERFNAEFVVCLNPDSELSDGSFVSHAVTIFQEFPYSVLAPRIAPDSPSAGSNPIIDHIPEAAGWESLQQDYERLRSQYFDTGAAEFPTLGTAQHTFPYRLDCVPQGAALVFSPVVTRSATQVFDDLTFLYGEEFLLAERAHETAHRILYDERLTVRHVGGASTDLLSPHAKYVTGYENAIRALRTCALRSSTFAASERGEVLRLAPEELRTLTTDGRRHLLVDLLFAQPGLSGGAEYGREIFRELCRSSTIAPETQVWAALSDDEPLDPGLREIARQHAVRLVHAPTFTAIADLVNHDCFGEFFAPALIAYSGYSYLSEPPDGFMLRPHRTRVCGTLHDVRDLEFALAQEADPSWNGGIKVGRVSAQALSGMYEEIVNSPAVHRLLTDSQAARDQLRTLVVPAASRPIEVVYPPDINLRSGIASVALPSRYLLILAGSRPEKNAARMVDAYRELLSRNVIRGIPLVVCGGIDPAHKPRWAADIESGNLVVLPFLDEPDFLAVVTGATGLLYASLAEGFGYPPLQAMRYGIPSLASDTPVSREIYGDAVIYCDPYSIPSITEGIARLLALPPSPETLSVQHATIAERQRSDLRELIRSLLLG